MERQRCDARRSTGGMGGTASGSTWRFGLFGKRNSVQITVEIPLIFRCCVASQVRHGALLRMVRTVRSDGALLRMITSLPKNTCNTARKPPQAAIRVSFSQFRDTARPENDSATQIGLGCLLPVVLSWSLRACLLRSLIIVPEETELEMRSRCLPTRSSGEPTTRLIFTMILAPLLLVLAPLTCTSTSSSSAVYVAAFSFETASEPATQRQQRPSEPSRPPPTVIPEDEDLLMEMQAKHREVAETFVPSKFDPLPGFGNPHLQTIGGVFLRKSEGCSYVSEPGLVGITKILTAVASIDNSARDEDVCDYWDRRVRVETQCGADFFHADVKYAGKPSSTWQSEDSKGTIVLIHGLESNSNSSLSTDMASAYQTDGFDVICLNFRGCCGTPNLTLGGYHLGFTDDLRHFLQVLREAWENNETDERPIYLSGFSLGANVVLKTLGELGETAMTKYNVQGASVTGAPFDLERNIKCIDAPGFNRAVYSNNFLKTLKKRAQYQLDVHCEGNPLTKAFDYARVMKATAIADFDDSFIAPVYGFESNIDYYRQSSCVYFLDGIAVPTFIVNAGDDPFFDPNFHPIDKSVDGGGKAPIKMVRTKYGGHLGYLFHRLSDVEKREKRTSSWMPSELARFVRHIHNYDY